MTEQLVVLPGYFDPADVVGWEQVLAHAAAMRLVVLNPASGPGEALRPEYVQLAARLRAAGIRTLGYVNTDYGTRARAEVRAEVGAFREWYDVDGIFFDQVSSGLAGLDAYEEYVLDARSLGSRFLALNPGCYPHPAYASLANLVVVFEGDAAAQRATVVPDWVRDVPARRFCHLVYDVPSSEVDEVRRQALKAHAGGVYVTDGAGSNPWGRLPSYWPVLASSA